MRLLGSRRATVVACIATAAALALTGCSAGQIAETAIKKPSVPGLNADTADGSVAVRNLSIFYNGPEGYEEGGEAPIEVALVNQTRGEIVVTVSSVPAEAGGEAVVSGRMVTLGTPSSGAPSAEPSASASSEPAEPAGQPGRITLPAHGTVSFLPGDEEQLTVTGLTGALRPGQSVNLVFEFSNGAEALVLQAPVSVPLSPAPRGSSDIEEEHEG